MRAELVRAAGAANATLTWVSAFNITVYGKNDAVIAVYPAQSEQGRLAWLRSAD